MGYIVAALGHTMAHTIRNKNKLLNRVRRIQGQLGAVAASLEEEEFCEVILQGIVTCRGAINALMAEILQGHIREHLLTGRSGRDQVRAAEQLVSVIKTYLK